jgi:hypothetical protein
MLLWLWCCGCGGGRGEEKGAAAVHSLSLLNALQPLTNAQASKSLGNLVPFEEGKFRKLCRHALSSFGWPFAAHPPQNTVVCDA